MKIRGFSALALLSLLTIPAFAGEPATSPSDWSGLYFGANGGYGWGSTNIETSGSLKLPLNGLVFDFSTDGGVAGGTAGYNWQFNNMVLGLEGDIDWANITGDSAPIALGGLPTVITAKMDWLATLRARVGFTVDRFLVFGTAGLAGGGFSGVVSNFPHDGMMSTASGTQYGYSLGGGIEMALAPHVSAKAEYMHVDLGTGSYRLGGTDANALTAAFHPKADLVRFGINYRF